jgi:hypothetical protein
MSRLSILKHNKIVKEGIQLKSKTKSKVLFIRVMVSFFLVVVGGFATLGIFTWSKGANADVALDPFFSLSSGPPRVRVFSPIQKSLNNASSFEAKGQAPANTEVEIKVDGVSAGTALTDASGEWRKQINNIQPGNHTLGVGALIGGPLIYSIGGEFPYGVSAINVGTNSRISSMHFGPGTFFYKYTTKTEDISGYKILLSQDKSKVYIVRAGGITVLESATGRVIKTVPISLAVRNTQEQLIGATDVKIKELSQTSDKSKFYMIVGNTQGGLLFGFDTINDTLIGDANDPQKLPQSFDVNDGEANGLAISGDGGKLYVSHTNKDKVTVFQNPSTTVSRSVIDLDGNVNDIVTNEAGDGVYVLKAMDSQGHYSIANILVADDSVNESEVDLGTTIAGNRLFLVKDLDKLYVSGPASTTLRVIDTSIAPHQLVGSGITLPKYMESNTEVASNSQNDSIPTRLYFPMIDGEVAVIDGVNNSLISVISTPSPLPASNYKHVNDMTFYNQKLFIAYDRDLTASDATNPAAVYQSLGVANAAVSSDIKAEAVNINSSNTLAMTEPIAIAPQAFSTSVEFSVGQPVTISGPLDQATLNTTTPTVTGTGPKNEVIQIQVNSLDPINVQVSADGTWSAVVTLPKDQNSKITATYNNKRSQVVIPNTMIFGENLARSNISLIDSESDLEQQSIELPKISLESTKLNTSIALHPNGTRYYLLNSNFTSVISKFFELAYTQGDKNPIIESIFSDLATRDMGKIEIYSAQTKQKVTDINLPTGYAPGGITVSPNGKKAAVWALNATKTKDVFHQITVGATTQNLDSPVEIFMINLENNTLNPTPITLGQLSFPASPGPQEYTPEQIYDLYLAIASLGFFGSRTANFSADSSKIYTTSMQRGVINVIDTDTLQVTSLSMPSQAPNDLSNAIVLSTQYNKNNKMLYATYAKVTLPASENDPVQVVPGLLIVNTVNNQFMGNGALPEIPFSNFAVSNDGSKVYLLTLNADELLPGFSNDVAAESIANLEVLPQFTLATYDLNRAPNDPLIYTTRQLTNTEIPISMALSPSSSKLYITSLAQNTVRVYDTASDTLDTGNAPIMLRGLAFMIGSSEYTGEAIIGTYDASANYFVSEGAQQTAQPTPSNTAITPIASQFNFASASTVPEKAQSVELPNKLARSMQDSIKEVSGIQSEDDKKSSKQSWLIYLFYAIFMSGLAAAGFAVWQTTLLFGPEEVDSML